MGERKTINVFWGKRGEESDAKSGAWIRARHDLLPYFVRPVVSASDSRRLRQRNDVRTWHTRDEIGPCFESQLAWQELKLASCCPGSSSLAHSHSLLNSLYVLLI